MKTSDVFIKAAEFTLDPNEGAHALGRASRLDQRAGNNAWEQISTAYDQGSSLGVFNANERCLRYLFEAEFAKDMERA